MDVIPGIDLLAGRCVCALHRPFADDAAVSHSPTEVASIWAAEGARRLFIADLDGARMGVPRNLQAVKDIIAATGLPVDYGGGIRTLETVKKVLDIGVDRIVIGTTAALEEKLTAEIFNNAADRTILSIASLNGYVAVRDWQARTDERAERFALRMCELGAKRIVFTDVSRKGMHGGINVPAVRRMAKSLNVPIIASGGVSSLDDIKDLKSLEPIGLEGVIVVSAIYSGTIKLSDAIELGDKKLEI